MNERKRKQKQALLLIIAGLCMKKRRRKLRVERRLAAEPWLERRIQGTYGHIFSELRCENREDLQERLKLPFEAFISLLSMVTPLIEKKDTCMRESISPGARLEATLLYLLAGMSYKNLRLFVGVSSSSLSHIIPETSKAIYQVLKEDYLKIPDNAEEWKKVADGFENKWNFPNCIGAVHGKHIDIIPTPNSGKTQINYRGYHSVTMMAMADSNYEFIFVECQKKEFDQNTGVWGSSSLTSSFDENTAGVPPASVISNTNRTLPHVLVGDECLPLKNYLMIPFNNKQITDQQKILSYRVSRAHRAVLNAIGLMVTTFGVFQGRMYLSPDRVQDVILACASIHNFLLRDYAFSYIPKGSVDVENLSDGSFTPGSWRKESRATSLKGITTTGTNEAQIIQHEFMNYFNGEGYLEGQNNMLRHFR